MGNSDTKLSAQERAEIKNNTDFDRSEVMDYYKRFVKKYSTGFMTKEEFIQENMNARGGTEAMWEELFDAFNTDGDDKIDFKEFVIGLSLVIHGNTEEKLKWAFKLYDLDGNGVLDRNEVVHMFTSVFKARNTLQGRQASSSDLSYPEKADDLFNQMDADKDGKITLDEFMHACLHDEAIKDTIASALLDTIEVEKEQSELATFGHQVAGHKGKSAMRKDGKTILKPLAPQEFEFYQLLKKQDPKVQAFFPKCVGRKTIEDEDGETHHYIVLEDLTADLEAPSICDLKIGFRGHDDQASTTKVLQQKALCAMTTSSTLGFRMCGMRAWQHDGEYIVRDKLWGSKLKENTMKGALVQFLDNGKEVRFELIGPWLQKLRKIEKWFEHQKDFHFYSSSVLLIYDGKADRSSTQHLDVRLVDFAHTFPAKTKDENYLAGLKILIGLLEEIKQEGESVEEVWENQRRKTLLHKYSSEGLFSSDRNQWSDANGKARIRPHDESWQVDATSEGVGEAGWLYSFNWGESFRWLPKSTKNTYVRRRKWVKPGNSSNSGH
ncbi:Guanylyl cyclase-activating protein 1 [Balamuthia mandrillaris]